MRYISRFVNLVNKSNLRETGYKYYYSLIDHAMRYSKNPRSSFYDDESFLKAVEIILRSSIKDDSKYVSITSLILCLKSEDIADNPQIKLNVILYALLISYGVIHTYFARAIPHVPCIKRLDNKRSDVEISNYLLDNQMIKEDILWLKNKDLKKFKELCGDINKMQDKEIKETFENYLNQINYEEKHNTLKYTAGTLAAICVVTGIIAIAGKSAVIGVITAIAGIMLGICILYNNKLKCVNVIRKSKECAGHNSNFFAGPGLFSVTITKLHSLLCNEPSQER